MNLFKLHRSYSISFNLSNVGEIFWGWIRKALIQVLKKKKKILCCVHLLYKTGVVVHLQICCFSDLNLLFFVCLFVCLFVCFFSWHMGDRVAVAEELFWTCGLGVTVPPVVPSKPQFQNTFSATANLFPMLLIPIETHRYESDCLRKAPKAYLIHKAKTIYPLQMNKLEEQ